VTLTNALLTSTRLLEDVHHWKAAELRSFLLYSGRAALKGIITEELCDHFKYSYKNFGFTKLYSEFHQVCRRVSL
jgi:hypothetical protein